MRLRARQAARRHEDGGHGFGDDSPVLQPYTIPTHQFSSLSSLTRALAQALTLSLTVSLSLSLPLTIDLDDI